MKFITIIASFLLIAGCAHSSGKSPIDIDGTWKGEMKGRTGGMQYGR